MAVEQARESLGLTFLGPGVDAGTMDVRELAPALLGLSGLFQQANRIVNPTAPDVALEIRATSRSSFKVDLELAVDVAVAVLAGSPLTALANLKTVVIDPTIGVIRLITGRHRGEVREEQGLENGDVAIVWSNGGSVTFPAAVAELERSIEVRQELEQVVRPLESEDVDEVALSGSSREVIRITKGDLPAFSPGVLETGRPVHETIVTVTLAVVAPSFDRKKWRVSDGGSTFWVTIDDPEFLEHIDEGERFGKGDFLRCRLRYRQFETPTGLRLEREVIQVIEHQQRPPPPPALFSN